MNTPPTPRRVRLTFTVTPQVHAAYCMLAESTGRSIGMEMGDWLDHTLGAALSMVEAMAEAREAPRRALEEIHTLTTALASVERVRKSSAGASSGPVRRSAEPDGRPGRSIPPSSNTGGKGPKTPPTGVRK